MHVLWQIIRSEFISNVLTSRFMIGLLVALLATGIAVLVQVDDYEKRLTVYNTAVQEAQVEARQWDVYGTITLKAHRKPNPLSIFNAGMENFGANTVSVEPSTPIFEMSSVLDGPAQKRGSDNPFLVMFLTVDLNFVFKMLLSLLAILFAYNTISGEREDGTFENPTAVRRWATYLAERRDTEAQLADQHINLQLRQVQFARNLSHISPIACFQYAMEGLANTGVVSYMNFVKQARRYRQTFIDFIKTEDRSDPESLHIYPVREGLSQKPVNPQAIPRFQERVSHESVLLPIGLLILFNLLLFSTAHIFFSRAT